MTRLVRLVTAAMAMLLVALTAGCGSAPATAVPTPLPSPTLLGADATATPAPTVRATEASSADVFEEAPLVLRVMHTNDVAGYTDPCG